jgi:MFS family permease
LRALPTGIWALGIGSLFMDISSEMIHSLLPIFMTTVLGASVVTVGLLEGIAEATVSVTKVFSGVLSDRSGKRKPLVVFGYTLAAFTKPIFPLAQSIGWVFAARFIDRIGKGIRGAPRDALIADITPSPLRGAAYGLRQALDSIGAFVGPLLAVIFMMAFAEDLRAVMWVAALPAFMAVAVLAFYVREPERKQADAAARPPKLNRAVLRQLPSRYWLIVLLSSVFTLARFSEAFLILRAQNVGLAIGYVPLVMIAMNVLYAAFAYPAGAAADRMSARTLLLAGLAVLIVADISLAFASAPALVFVGAALWGVHMALTQGLFSKLVADAAPPQLRGTAFGLFNLVTGGALLLASVIAGVLWNALGASTTFVAGAAFAAVTVVGLLAYRPKAS